jgi:hypothetical protein
MKKIEEVQEFIKKYLVDNSPKFGVPYDKQTIDENTGSEKLAEKILDFINADTQTLDEMIAKAEEIIDKL